MMEAAARIALNDDSPDGLDHAVVDAQKVWMMGDDTQQVPGEFDLLFQRVACGDLPESPPGLVIISDAPVEPIPIYGAGYVQNGSTPLKTVPEPAHTGPTLGVATIWWRILVLLCAGTAITEAYELASGWIYEHRLPHLNFAELFQYVIPLILSVVALATLLWLRSTGKKVLAGVDGILKIEGNAYKQKTGVPTSWPYLKHLRLSQLGYLLNVRATSMLSLVSDIFFIRHRILGFALLYMLPGWRRQLVSNEIYDLGVDGPSDAPTPTAAMIKVGATAAAEPTAFWFDRPEALEQLVAAGQMNLCRNLITWLRRERAQTKENFAPALADLLTRAEADWQTFCGDPLAMVPKSARPTSAQAAVK
jgi:hypothetical protein